MLWSQISNEVFWGGVATVITALAGAVVTVYVAVRKGRQERRADAIEEWQKYSAKMEQGLQERQQENANLRKQLHTLRDQHYADMIAVHAKQAACEKENTELRGEVKLLQMAMSRVQARVGDTPAQTSPCLIIIETDGTIRDASPATGPVLGWLSTELIGKNVEVVVPEDLRARHREALTKVAAMGQPPWSDRVVLTEALTKNGRRVKVSVKIRGWQTGGGHWLLSGEISERQSE